jgi:hypothetical protein
VGHGIGNSSSERLYKNLRLRMAPSVELRNLRGVLLVVPLSSRTAAAAGILGSTASTRCVSDGNIRE